MSDVRCLVLRGVPCCFVLFCFVGGGVDGDSELVINLKYVFDAWHSLS